VAASYVGRVGALAVALGVGSAVFAGQGMAWADDGASSASKPSASATSGDNTADTQSSTTKPDDATQTDDDTADDTATDDSATDTEELGAEDPDVEEPDIDSPQVDTDSPDDEVDGPDDEAEPEPAAESDDRTPAKPAGRAERDTEPEAEVEAGPQQSAQTSERDPSDTTATPRDTEDIPSPQTSTTVTVDATAAKATTGTASSTLADLSTTEQGPQTAAAKPNLITAVVNVVNSMIDWARQKAAADPGDAPQPPFLWALMAFARRELDTLFAARTSNSPRSSTAASTSLTLGDAATAAATTPQPFRSPWLNPQVSASTKFISWVTGAFYDGDYALLANTLKRFNVYGTDVGVMWDNGMVDDPSTPDIDERQVLIAVGDTFGGPGMTGRHIYNSLFRSSDRDLADGMTIPDGEWFNGNMFGGAPLDKPDQSRPIIERPAWLPGSVTLIPTAGVSLPTEVSEDTPFGTIQYVSFMSVTRWGQSGRWSTNYSGIAYSTDNGENFTVAPSSVRYNSFFSGNRNFQQSAFVKGDDGYVYMYGTPNGRQGAAYLARVAPEDILNASKYEYYKKASSGWFGGSPARWVGSPSSASAIIGKSGGLFGFTKPGYTVSEMSVQYNEYLKKYIVLYGDQSNNIVMRTSDTPEGGWSDATVLMRQQTGGIYAPMLHPWSPSTEGTGSTLYWNLSLWSEYNIMLMETDLSKI